MDGTIVEIQLRITGPTDRYAASATNLFRQAAADTIDGANITLESHERLTSWLEIVREGHV